MVDDPAEGDRVITSGLGGHFAGTIPRFRRYPVHIKSEFNCTNVKLV